MNHNEREDAIGSVFSSAGRFAREEIAKREKRGCAYPDCSNHKGGVKTYCCNGCRWDHADWKDAQPFQDSDVFIEDRFAKTAEIWFLRHVEQGWGERRCMEMSWLVLLNGAYQSTDHDRANGTQWRITTKDDYRIVDTNYIPVHWSETKYLQIAQVRKKQDAELIAKALNAYQPKPQRRSKNG
jgi:hypothetical protein